MSIHLLFTFIRDVATLSMQHRHPPTPPTSACSHISPTEPTRLASHAARFKRHVPYPVNMLLAAIGTLRYRSGSLRKQKAPSAHARWLGSHVRAPLPMRHSSTLPGCTASSSNLGRGCTVYRAAPHCIDKCRATIAFREVLQVRFQLISFEADLCVSNVFLRDPAT